MTTADLKAVELVRSIREAHHEQIKDLPVEERIAFFRDKARALYAELGQPDPTETYPIPKAHEPTSR